jgi:hypothetical protein
VNQAANPYVMSIQSERIRQRMRYHWIICGTQSPDDLISWGYAQTQELAEIAARQEMTDLSSGLSNGGQVISVIKEFTRRRWH